MKKSKTSLPLDAPLAHAAHKKPITRRDFLAQGFLAGMGTVIGSSLYSQMAHATLSNDISTLLSNCNAGKNPGGKIPFICFDLAGGANISGSNVLVGKQNGQLDFLSTAGYSKLGLPGDMIPSATNPTTMMSYINSELGLAFHSESAMLRGIFSKTLASTRANVNGAVIPARSDNDTGNNPHNPMYGINIAGANGDLLNLIGSRSSDSGGNSMMPSSMFDPSVRPTKIDRPSDVTGLVDLGDLLSLVSQDDAVAVMESVQRISQQKLGRVSTRLAIAEDTRIKKLINCAYAKSAEVTDTFGNIAALDVYQDPDIVGPAGIFGISELNNDSEFQKTASVMKLVINGHAGAGTITMGGYDYHTGDRATGELRDERAGRCIGACLDYARRVNSPVMIYVFSDGSVASNGAIDNSVNGGGKGQWTGDNSSTAAAFFLVYNPGSRPQLIGANADDQSRHQQLGYMRPDASVETAATPAANNVNLLVETVVLNYMALHGEQGSFPNLFPNHGLGSSTLMDSLTAFEPII